MAELNMSNDEILASWRDAKDRKAQITILAELNATTEEDIRDRLIAQGVDGRQLPRKARPGANRPKKDAAAPGKADTCRTAEGEEIPMEAVIRGLRQELERTESRKRGLAQRVEMLTEAIRELEETYTAE